MARKVGELAIQITGNTKGLNRSFNKTKAQSKGLGGVLGGLKSKLASLGPAAVAGIAAAGLAAVGAATKKVMDATIEYADTIDKTSQRMGMSAEATQEWKYISEQLGASISSLERGMGRFQKRVGEADDGLSSAQRAFENLDIEIKNADGSLRTMDTLMPETIKKLQDMEDVTKRNQLAQELFGRGGKELIPILNAESSTIDDLKQKAHDLGLVMGEENVDAGVKLKDTIHSVKSAFGGIIRSIGVELMPAMQNMADWIVEHMPQIKKVVTSVVDAVIIAFKSLYYPIEAVVKIIKQWYNWLELGFLHLKKITADTVNWLLDKLPALEKLPLGMGDAVKKIRKNAKLISEDTQEAINNINKRSKELKDNLDDLEDEQKDNTEASFNQQEQSENTADAVEELNSQFEDLQQNEEESKNKSEQLTEKLKNLRNELTDVDVRAKIFGDEIDITSEKARILKSNIIDLIDEGFSPNNIRIRQLIEDYRQYQDQIESSQQAQENYTTVIQENTEAKEKNEEQTKENTEKQRTSVDVMIELKNQLSDVEDQQNIFGGTMDKSAKKSELLKDAIMELVEMGFTKESHIIKQLLDQYNNLNSERSEIDKLKNNLDTIDRKESALGDLFDANSRKVSAYQNTINALIEEGYDPQGEAIQNLVDKLKSLREENEKTKKSFQSSFTGERMFGLSNFDLGSFKSPSDVFSEQAANYGPGATERTENNIKVEANYNGMNEEEAKAANDDLVGKLKERGYGGAYQ